MTNGNDDGMSPELSGQSRARARERLVIEHRCERLSVVEASSPGWANLFVMDRNSTANTQSISLDSAQQLQLAEWLLDGSCPARWLEPAPAEGVLQFVTPTGYSELRLHQLSDECAMLGLRAGDNRIDFILTRGWMQQLAAKLWQVPPAADATEFIARYCGVLDPAVMRFSAAEMGIAFAQGQAAGLAHNDFPAEASNTETAEPAAPAFLREDYEPASVPPTCLSCDHWNPSGEGHGQCRRNAPIVTGGMHCPVSTEWPDTLPGDWCGEHSSLIVSVTSTPCTVEPWEREGRVPPGYADSWDRTPEDVAKAGTLTWAVAQLGAVADTEGNAIHGWLEGWRVEGRKSRLTDWELISLV